MGKKYIYARADLVMIGLPTRDMTEKEWNSYPKELTQAALAQGLYVEKQETKEAKDA